MSSLLYNLTYLLFLNSFLFLITFSVFLNSFQNYFFKWLTCLQVSSVLMNCNIMVFLSFFCIQLFPTFFMIQVFPGPGSGFGSGCRFYKSPYTWGCLCDNWKPRFLPLLIFNWRILSRRVTALWWRQWAKKSSVNQSELEK